MSSHPPFSPVGQNIKNVREAKGISQRALAVSLGMKYPGAQAVICRWETGVYEPRWKSVKAVAVALGVNVAHLMREQEKKPKLTSYAERLLGKKK